MLQAIDYIDKFIDFTGNAEELISASKHLANDLRLPTDGQTEPTQEEITPPIPAEESEPLGNGNERLLRHYVSLKVVDRPARKGRDAIYGFRHLLQFLTARRLLASGFGLAKIAQYTSVVPTQSLAQALTSPPLRSEAELLVTAYKSSEQRLLYVNERALKPKLAAPAKPQPASRMPPFNAPLGPETMHGMADLLHEVDKLRHRFREELEKIQITFQASLAELQKTLTEVRQGHPDQRSLELSWQEPTRRMHAEIMHAVSAMSARVEQQQEMLHAVMESRLKMLQQQVEESLYKVSRHIDESNKALMMEAERNREQTAALAKVIEMHAELLEKNHLR